MITSPRPSAAFRDPNSFVDSDHPEVVAFAEKHRSPDGEVASAVALYETIRDGWRYNPWQVSLEATDYRASALLGRSREQGGHCIDKALLLAGCARALGIPSRLHFANVRNHIGTAKLEAQLGTDLLVFHGYTGLYLEGRWVAATPAFNKELCAHLGVPPLAFNGREDSIFQAFSPEGGRFIEYVEDHGAYPELPHAMMLTEWARHYGHVARDGWPTGT